MNDKAPLLDDGTYKSLGERSAPRWVARLFLPFLVLTSMLPPFALAAPSPSLMAQTPPFIDVGAQPNVMFIMDDSLSMDDIRLPVPAGINPSESTGGNIAVRGRASAWSSGGGWTVGAALTVPRVNEWIFRSTTLNPLYYNPNIRYQPWNDNGRLGTVTTNTFPRAVVGGIPGDPSITQANGWREGLTRHDMRYAGPNRTAANFSATQFRPDTDANRGSNPPDVPAYLAAGRPSKGGFDSGAAVVGKNYDLFSSPAVLVSGSSTNICLVAPTSPSTQGLPTQARPSVALPTQPRDSQARSSSALPTTTRTTFNRGSQPLPQTTRTAQTRPIYSAQPSAARPSVGRGSVPLGETTRTITPLTSSALPVAARTVSARASQPLPQTNRTVTARSSQALATQARGLTNQPVEYSWRVGDCATGAWSPWTTTYVIEFCSDPNSEGGVRVSPFQTRYQPCAAGTAIAGGAQCQLDCPAGFTPNPGDPAQCLGTCPGTFPALISGTCYADCAASTSINASDNTQCLSDCPGGQTPSGNPLVCQGTCSAGFGALIGTVCYADACPGGTTIHSNAAQCISDCTGGMTIDAGNPLQCVGTCPGGEPNRVGYVCYSTCPGGSAVDPGNAARCLSDCPGGELPVAGSNPPICRATACPGGFPTLSGTTCFANCSAGNTVVLPGQPGTCYADACPAGTPSVSGDICLLPCDAGTVLIGTTCYQPSCPAGFSVDPGNATQCLSDCPAGQAVISNALCEGTCTGGFPNRIGTTCYADCPLTEPVVNSSNAAQCLSTCPVGQTSFVNPLVCVGTCAGGFPTLVGTTCYANCSGGYPTISPLDNTQCLADCNTGYTVDPINALQCLGSCPPTRPNQVGNTCYRDCTGGFPTVNPLNVGQCQGPCPTGWTQSGTQCQQCALGSTLLSNGLCCPTVSVGQGNCPANRPVGMPCTDNTYVPDLDLPALARYYVFAPNPAIATPTGADYGNPANYVQVDINRDFTLVLFPKAVDRTDCAAADSCTWAEEAKNFANWYSYYRTRLFSAIAVTAQSLSGLTNANGKDQIRLGYGSINYFPNGFNPYAATDLAINAPRYSTSTSTTGSPAELDGQPSAGHIVRGVRPFSQIGNPNAVGTVPAVNADDRRQEVFNWLFSLRGTGSTPNREALDAVGQYYERSDNKGPWIEPDVPATWSTSLAAGAHIPCRRTYSILITDGEWTNAPYVSAAPQQPVLGLGGNTFPTNVTTSAGPAIADNPAGLTYQYTPSSLPQFSTNGNPSVGPRTADRTLTDVALYYWSRDLRPTLQNNIDVIAATPSKQGDPAFWQHMVPYIVGYGISASMDASASSTRSDIVNSANTPSTPTTINWPDVIMEQRPADSPGTIVTDRDTAPINCGFNATGTAQQRSGCGRVDDTMRAALAARGDFLAATNVSVLAQSVANVFDAIGEREGSGSALAARSSSIRAGDRLFYASFFTNSWVGRVTSFDAVAYATGIVNNTGEPTTFPERVGNSFPAPGARNIFTSDDVLAAGLSFPTVAADMSNLNAAQQAALGSIDLARWVRGFQDRENRNGGGFRNRGDGEFLADIVNSAPLYSKAADQLYSSQRRPAGDTSTGNDAAADSYRVHVNRNRQYRPATLFVGSNTGKLHAFDVSGSPVATLPGPTPNPNFNANYMREKFAYVPRAVYSKFVQLASPAYSHQFLMDGQIIEGDIFDGGQWKTVVVGATGAGPKGIFALDVTMRSGTTPAAFAATDVIWDIADGDSVTNIGDLGHIMGPGVIGSGKDGGWYYFTGNGYESTNDKARLLAVCLGGTCTKGAILSIATDNFGGTNTATGAPLNQQPNGLGAITPVYDAKRNIVGIYAGDRLGRLWKFDLSSSSSASWASATGTSPLFEAVNSASVRQPITAAPRVFAYPLGGRMIVFGTGKLFEETDRADGSVQSVYAVREENVTSPTVVTKSQLRQFTLTQTTTAGVRVRVISGTGSFVPTTDRGWYFDLSGTGIAVGERVIASPFEQFGFANVTSYTPVGLDVCKPGGESFFYRLDVASNFTRLPFQGFPLNTVATEVPPTVAAANLVNQRSNETSATQGNIGGSSLGAFGAGGAPTRSLATDPCAGSLAQKALVRSVRNKGGTAPKGTCENPALRVWRDLPNSINRN